MSNNSQQYDQPGCGHFFLSFIGIAVLLGLFSLIVNIAYVPTRQNAEANAAEARKAYRLELEAKQHQEATTYAWVNQQKGTVRIPIERAMELTVRALSGGPSSK